MPQDIGFATENNRTINKDALLKAFTNGSLIFEVLPDERRIITTKDRTLLMFSMRTGKCMKVFQGHDSCVTDIAVVNEDNAVSVDRNGRVYVWRLSKSMVIHFCQASEQARIAALASDCFAVFQDAETGGRVEVYVWEEEQWPTQLGCIQIGHRIVSHCVWKSRIATYDASGRVLIWDCSYRKDQKLACVFESSDLGVEENTNCVDNGGFVSMNDRIIVIARNLKERHSWQPDRKFARLLVYDAANFNFLTSIDTQHREFDYVQVVFSSRLILSCFRSFTVPLARDSEVLARPGWKDFKNIAESVSRDCRSYVGFRSGTFKHIPRYVRDFKTSTKSRLRDIKNVTRPSYVCLYDTQSKGSVWESELGNSHVVGRKITVFSNGQIAVFQEKESVTQEKQITLLSPGKNLMQIVKRSSDIKDVNSLPPLQRALAAYLAGRAPAVKFCRTLINPRTCSVSFEEWLSAHKLLMMAVVDGDIPRSGKFDRKSFYWFDNLYCPLKDVPLASEEDLEIAKQCIQFAKENGLVETVEATLGALHVTRDVNQLMKAVGDFGRILWRYLTDVDSRHEALRQLFEGYKADQRKRQLVAIALRIIPIAGGTFAGVYTAGAEMLHGLSCKDVTDYVLSLGTGVAEDATGAVQNRASSFEDDVIRKAAECISPKFLETLSAENRLKLTEEVGMSGHSVEEFHQILNVTTSTVG